MSTAASYLNPWAWKEWYQAAPPAAEAVELRDLTPKAEPKYTPVYTSVPTVTVTLPRERVPTGETPCCSSRSVTRVGLIVLGTVGMIGCVAGAVYYGNQLSHAPSEQQEALKAHFWSYVGGAILSPIVGCLGSLCLRPCSANPTQADMCADGAAQCCLTSCLLCCEAFAGCCR